MKRLHIEILLGILFVAGGTLTVYNLLAPVGSFWSAQNIWSTLLIICWCVVASGYWHQGFIVREAKSSTHVSLMLSVTVFLVQCILFVKGIYYKDISLIIGAVVVNSGVIFNIYQIIRFAPKHPPSSPSVS